MERPPDERQSGETHDDTPTAPFSNPQSTSHLPEPSQAPSPGPYAHPPPGYPPPYYHGPIVQAKTNGFAVASMVLGILWIYWIGSILALVFGMIAKSQIDQSGGMQQGRGMAIAGIVLGWVGVGFLLLFVVFFGGVAGCGALLGT